MGKPHKHAEVIKAWADDVGIELQCREIGDTAWMDIYITPHWDYDMEYRIKPEKGYPVTGMDHAHLIAAYGVGGYEEPAEPNSLVAQGYERIANAAIRHAIDSGQVVLPTKEGE